MKIFTYQDVCGWSPGSSVPSFLRRDWQGTVLDLLRYDHMPPQLRLMAVLRPEVVTAFCLRMFAVQSARRVHYLADDIRSAGAIDAAFKYAYDEIELPELEAAGKLGFQAWMETHELSLQPWESTEARWMSEARCAAYRATDESAAMAAWMAALSAAEAEVLSSNWPSAQVRLRERRIQVQLLISIIEADEDMWTQLFDKDSKL